MQKGQLLYKVTKEECSWLPKDLERGKVVYRYDDHITRPVSDQNIAVLNDPKESAFFEVPFGAVLWEPPLHVQGVKAQIAFLLEECGIRCSKCRVWWSQKAIQKKILCWGSNLGNILMMDPYYLHLCQGQCTNCGHFMFDRIRGTSPA